VTIGRKKRPPPAFVLFEEPTVETARKALERGDLPGFYRQWCALMKDAGLPLDWFASRRPGDSLH